MIIIFPAHVYETFQKFQFETEYRGRFERRQDKDFSKTNRDNRTDFFQRARVGMKFQGDGNWTGFAQFQFAHDLITTPQRNSSDESRDILLAYAQQKNANDKLTLGRQKIDIGSERLIGSIEWINRSRSFDAIRFQNSRLDVFAAEVGIQNLQPQQARIVGVSVPNRDGATSLIFKHDKNGASTDHWTLSVAAKGKFFG
ncbi:MAG: alginate export family protein, partial [Armatimonadota bacterium]